MTSDIHSFAKCALPKASTVNDRALAFMFYRSQLSDIPEVSIKEICDDFLTVGLPEPNNTRLKEFLSKSKLTTKVGASKWRIRVDKMSIVADQFGDCIVSSPVNITETDSVIPRIIGDSLPSYCKDVIRQINGCYDAGFFDPSGVMLRRLVESLIIEIFEKNKIESKIKDKDGNYFMLNKLITQILSEPTLSLGRNAKKGLNNAKWLGDQSAHNRRFFATQADIDRVQPDIRILVQEFAALLK